VPRIVQIDAGKAANRRTSCNTGHSSACIRTLSCRSCNYTAMQAGASTMPHDFCLSA
jgi:hypothetical protein